MKIHRFVLGSVAPLGVVGVALMAGVALGSGSAHTDGSPPQAAPGEQAAPTTAKAAKTTMPKAQAYVHFDADGNILGPSKKVVAVHHYQSGGYCIELAKSIHVGDETYAIAFVDYFHPTAAVTIQMYSYSTWCIVDHGFPNSVAVLPLTSTRTQTDAAMYFLVP
jgi:hypothetical protein